MPYSSSLTDREWEILEPLLFEILPTKKQTLSLKLEEAADFRWHLLSTEKWLQLARLNQRFAALFDGFYWHYKQWRETGAIEQLMSALHGQVREGVKKKPSGQP